MSEFVTLTPIPSIPSVGSLTYRLPEDLRDRVQVGMRLLVPLGRRRVTGLATAITAEGPEGITCRDVESVLDTSPIIPDDLIRLVEWMASYYGAPFAEVLSLAIGRGLTATSKRYVTLVNADAAHSPLEIETVRALATIGKEIEPGTLARKMGRPSVDAVVLSLQRRGAVEITSRLEDAKIKARFERCVRVVRLPDDETASAAFRRAPRRQELFEYLVDRPGRQATFAELGALFASPSSAVEALTQAGLVEVFSIESLRTPATFAEPPKQLILNSAQQAAVDAVEASLGKFEPFLLHGVTSSGKTEIYLQLIARVLERGDSALVLVPEISLTHQVLARLAGRFGDQVALLHSELSPGERWDQWRRIARGDARIAIGARSAVLAPLDKLGIIIVDEEHDSSYKQDDGVRYHGRDVAVMRANLSGCPIVLGSATPSLESWQNAQTERYTLLSLPERVTPSPLPFMEVVDLRGRDINSTGGLSEHLTEQMRKNFSEGNQTLLFLNRRGYALNLQCYECGETVECANCSVGMTLHQDAGELRCHHCDARRKVPGTCPSCSRDALLSQGVGTQRLETAVRAAVPGARVARLDRDTTGTKGASGSILQDWKHGRVDILIGTQMVAKGHDVPGVTLVGVIQADMALGVPDFRAGERTYQLLSQVAGRAGRGELRGKVIAQTYQPDHPAIQAAVRHRFEPFAEEELQEREDLGYPPIRRMIIMRFAGKQREAVERIALRAARTMEARLGGVDNTAVRGPAPAVIERRKSFFHYKLQICGESGAAIRHAALGTRAELADQARRSSVRIVIDVDPQDTQ